MPNPESGVITYSPGLLGDLEMDLDGFVLFSFVSVTLSYDLEALFII